MLRDRIHGEFLVHATAVVLALTLMASFAYAAVRGPYGLAHLAALEDREVVLMAQLSTVETERKRMENLTRRLSDHYLDLDLLDGQARKRLGLIRPDEIIIR